MEYLGTIYKGSQSDIIFPVPFIELSDGATVDFYTDGDGGFSRTKDEIKIDNYMLKTTASADELNSLNDGVLNYTINTCMGKSEGDTGLYLSKPSSYVDKQYLTADGVKTINGESIVGQGNIEIQGGGSEDYIIQLGSGGTITNLNLTNEQITEVAAAINDGKKIYIVDNNKESKYTVFEQRIYNGHITLHYGLSSYRTYKWVGDINFKTSQQTTAYPFQMQLSSNSFLNVRDLNLKSNKGVDNILTNLKKDIFITGFDLSKGGLNSTYTVDGNFDTIKSYFTTHQIKGIDTTGEIFNLDFRMKTDGTLAASYINRNDFSNINNKIYTFILSPNTDDNSKMNVQNYITSFDDIYDKINKTSDIASGLDKRISVTEDDLNTLSGSVVNNYYTKTEVDDKIKNISGGTSDSETYIWEWGSLNTGDTTFTNEQITEIENAYNDGKNIIVSLNGGKMYPTDFILSKDGNDVLISMNFLENGNNCYKWEYYNYVSNDLSGQTLELTKFMAEGNNVNIKCKSITTQGHGNLDDAITNLQKQIESGSSENLQAQINSLNQGLTVEGDVRKKVDDNLQQQINNVAEGIPIKTSQLTNDSGYLTSVPSEYAKTADIANTYLSMTEATSLYLQKTDASKTYQPKGNYLTEHQSLEEYYTKAQTYSKSEIDTKIGDINNILESI